MISMKVLCQSIVDTHRFKTKLLTLLLLVFGTSMSNAERDGIPFFKNERNNEIDSQEFAKRSRIAVLKNTHDDHELLYFETLLFGDEDGTALIIDKRHYFIGIHTDRVGIFFRL